MVSGVMSTEPAPSVAPADNSIQEVWRYNLEQEFKNIRRVIKNYNYVAVVIHVLTLLFGLLHSIVLCSRRSTGKARTVTVNRICSVSFLAGH